MARARFALGGEPGWGLAMIALLNFYVLTALLLAASIWSAVSFLLS
jgi:hypothetical protein